MNQIVFSKTTLISKWFTACYTYKRLFTSVYTIMCVADIDDTRSDLDSFIKRHADKLVLPEDRTKIKTILTIININKANI